MRHSLGRVSGVVGVAVVLMSLASSAQQRWYEAYDEGITAFRRMQWSVAEQKFMAALALKSAQEQGQRVFFYGTRREPYLPEYYLAQVYLKLGRNKEAADLFAKVERNGRITARDPQFNELKSLIAGIPAHVVVAGGLGGDSVLPPADGGGPSRGSGGSSLPGGGVPGGGGAGPGGNPTSVADNNALPTGAAPGGGVAPTGRGPGVDARGGSSPLAGGGAAVAPPNSLPANPAAATIERAALRAFFEGNYRTALTLLDNTALKQNPTPRRLFYLACSNAALGLLEGDKGRSRITAARVQFAQAKGLDSQFAVDRRYISPRILATLENVRR